MASEPEPPNPAAPGLPPATGHPPRHSGWRFGMGAWFLLSVGLSFIGNTIPWGREDGFHGTGLPIANVIWDRPPDRDRLIDYPNPLALILNPVLIFVAGLTLWLVGWLAWRLLRWMRHLLVSRSV